MGDEETIECHIENCNADGAGSYSVQLYRVHPTAYTPVHDEYALPGFVRMTRPDSCTVSVTFTASEEVNGVTLQCRAVSDVRELLSLAVVIGVRGEPNKINLILLYRCSYY